MRTDDVVNKVLLSVLLAVVGNGIGDRHLRGQVDSVGTSRVNSSGCAPRIQQVFRYAYLNIYHLPLKVT